MKYILVVDDLRTLTVDEETEYGLVTYCRTLEAAMDLTKGNLTIFDEIWLDHDLGDGQDIRPFIRHLEASGLSYQQYQEILRKENLDVGDPPAVIRIITANPVGREYIRAALSKYYEVKDG